MLQLAAIFGNSMILSRRKPICIFGRADENTVVSVLLRDAEGQILGKSDIEAVGGNFRVFLKPQEAAENCSLQIISGKDSIEYSDVAIGDVYLAGGQSNMELELQNAKGGEEAIAIHKDPMFRYYNVPKVALHTEETLANEKNTRWQKIIPGNGKDISAVGYFFARKVREMTGVPVGIIDCNWGGTSISCWLSKQVLMESAEGQRYWREYFDPIADQTEEQFAEKQKEYQARIDAWVAVENRLSEEAGHRIPGNEVEKVAGPFPWPPPDGLGSFMRPGGLYNTMLQRIVPYGLTGVLFYQGEADCGRGTGYGSFMVDMVRSWRKAFRDNELPFLFTQLPMYYGEGPDDGSWAELRLMQSNACKLLSNTDLVIQIDQGEKTNIHPVDKVPVGERMYELARQVMYHQDGQRSPEALCMYQEEKHSLVIKLSAPVQGEPVLLEIAGKDGLFVPADVVIDGERLIVSSSQVSTPVHVRYAHVNWGEVKLFGQNGLPLAPFVF